MKNNIYDERKELIEERRKTNITIKGLKSEIKELKADKKQLLARNKKLSHITQSHKDKHNNAKEENEELTRKNKNQRLRMDIVFRISVAGLLYNSYLIYIKYFSGN